MSGWFFFSSRSRHTRYWRDWISVVCSSDLDGGAASGGTGALGGGAVGGSGARARSRRSSGEGATGGTGTAVLDTRSGERRVGKACRSRWSPYHSKKNTG